MASFGFARLLICGSEQAILNYEYRGEVTPAATLGSLYSFQALYRLPVVDCKSRQDVARLCELWAHYYCRNTLAQLIVSFKPRIDLVDYDQA